MDFISVIGAVGTVLGAIYGGLRLYTHFNKNNKTEFPKVSIEPLYFFEIYKDLTERADSLHFYKFVWFRMRNLGPGFASIASPRITLRIEGQEYSCEQIFIEITGQKVGERNFIEIVRIEEGNTVDVRMQLYKMPAVRIPDLKGLKTITGTLKAKDGYERDLTFNFELPVELK